MRSAWTDRVEDDGTNVEHDIQFVRLTPAGKVHLLGRLAHPAELLGDDDLIANTPHISVLARPVSLCGKRDDTRQSVNAVDFDDTDLCHRCVDMFPIDRRHELFQRQ